MPPTQHDAEYYGHFGQYFWVIARERFIIS
jgi:hypothetical protein